MRALALIPLSLLALMSGCARAPAETWRVQVVVKDWLGTNRGEPLEVVSTASFPLGSEIRRPGFLFAITDAGGDRRKLHLRCIPPGVDAQLDAPTSGRGGDYRVLDVLYPIDRYQAVTAETARISLHLERNP